MRAARRAVTTAVAGLATLALAAPAHAARSCEAPDSGWERATPAEAGMDAAKLQEALDYGTSNLGFAVRVYRHGCLVGEDRAAATNRDRRFESWSMAKSVTAMMFGRAMTQGLAWPDDPVGSLFPEADRGHGTILLRDLMTMTSGLRWNGFRDYNIFTMPDRVRDALTLDVVKPRASYYEYAQSPVSLLAAAVGRAVGGDPQAYVQRELMTPLSIPANAWTWTRDSAGNIAGFYGVNMRPDDFGRLGELMRRRGVWRGRRLLAESFITHALTPSATNGCYGWLIWVNAGSPCIGPTIGERPVSPNRDFPDLPADMYRFSGLFGQLVTVFPGQGLVVVRTGHDPNLIFAGGNDWERGLYHRVLGAITDQRAVPGGNLPPTRSEPNADYGFQTSLREPDQYIGRGFQQDPLPPAGPQRARSAQLSLASARPNRKGEVLIRLACPPRFLTRAVTTCAGVASLTGARRLVSYSVAPGRAVILRFSLRPSRLAALRRAGRLTFIGAALNRDQVGGARTGLVTSILRQR